MRGERREGRKEGRVRKDDEYREGGKKNEGRKEVVKEGDTRRGNERHRRRVSDEDVRKEGKSEQ